MSKHPTTIKGFEGTSEELGTQLANLDYVELEKILHAMAEKVGVDAIKDGHAGRNRLAMALKGATVALRRAHECIEEAARISKPHMQKESAPP